MGDSKATDSHYDYCSAARNPSYNAFTLEPKMTGKPSRNRCGRTCLGIVVGIVIVCMCVSLAVAVCGVLWRSGDSVAMLHILSH